MTTLYLPNSDTGEIVTIDSADLPTSFYIMNDDTGKPTLVNYSSLTGTIGIRDADTGEIVQVDLANPTGTIYVRDENTGELVAVNLGSPSGSLYIKNWNTGKPQSIDLSSDLVVSDHLLSGFNPGTDVIYSQDFEDLTVGELNGQDSWTKQMGVYSYEVVTGQSPHTGLKCVTNYVRSSISYRRLFSNTVTGTMVVHLKVDDPDPMFYVQTYGSESGAWINMGLDTGRRIVCSDTYTGYTQEIGLFTVGAWTKLAMQFDCLQHRHRISIDDGAWTTWYGIDAVYSGLNRIIMLGTAPTIEFNAWFDDIEITGTLA